MLAARMPVQQRDIRLESDETLVRELLSVYRLTDEADRWIASVLRPERWMAIVLAAASDSAACLPQRRPSVVALELARRERDGS